MNNNELQVKVLEWAEQKGLLTDVTEERIRAQAHKVLEEIGETCGAYLKGNREELLDGIGDISVTIILINEMDGNHRIDFSEEVGMPDYRNSLLHVATDFMKGDYRNAIECLELFAISQDTILNTCLELAYNVIAKRTGKMVGNTFIKD